MKKTALFVLCAFVALILPACSTPDPETTSTTTTTETTSVQDPAVMTTVRTY